MKKRTYTLKEDNIGFYIELSQKTKNKIDKYQREFIPYFLDLIEKYKKYEEWNVIDLEKPFVFSPKTIQFLSKVIIPDILIDITQNIKIKKRDNISISWSQSKITGVLNKLLAFESFSIERIMADRIFRVSNNVLQNNKTIAVKELCSGAGITTSLFYDSLNRKFDNIVFETVDNSLESVVCTSILLTIRNIPNRLILEPEKQESDFFGVKIYLDDAFDSFVFEKKYDIVFSDNGINYFSYTKHKKIIEKMIYSLNNLSVLQISTLDSNLRINLSISEMFRSIFKQNDVREGDEKYNIRSTGNTNEIISLYSASTILQYELLKNLFFNLKFGLFFKYLNGAKKAAEITKILSPQINQNLQISTDLIYNISGKEALIYPSYDLQKYSLVRYLEIINS